jgi:hypothetical protein
LGTGSRLLREPQGSPGEGCGRQTKRCNCRKNALASAGPQSPPAAPILHGKEGVSGSSPEEGFPEPAAYRGIPPPKPSPDATRNRRLESSWKAKGGRSGTWGTGAHWRPLDPTGCPLLPYWGWKEGSGVIRWVLAIGAPTVMEARILHCNHRPHSALGYMTPAGSPRPGRQESRSRQTTSPWNGLQRSGEDAGGIEDLVAISSDPLASAAVAILMDGPITHQQRSGTSTT